MFSFSLFLRKSQKKIIIVLYTVISFFLGLLWNFSHYLSLLAICLICLGCFPGVCVWDCFCSSCLRFTELSYISGYVVFIKLGELMESFRKYSSSIFFCPKLSLFFLTLQLNICYTILYDPACIRDTDQPLFLCVL